MSGMRTLRRMPRGSPKEPQTDYGQRLRDARLAAKLSQEELARRAGVTQSTIGELERKGQGSTHTAQLAAACGVRSEWLASGEAPMKPQALSAEMVEILLPIDQLTGEDRTNALEMLRNLRSLVRPPPPPPPTRPAQTVLVSSTKEVGGRSGKRASGK